MDARPSGLFHRQPAPIGVKPPFEHPVGLALFGRDQADDILAQTFRGLVDLEFGRKPIFILINVELTNLLDGLLNGSHLFLLTIRLQGLGVFGCRFISRRVGACLPPR